MSGPSTRVPLLSKGGAMPRGAGLSHPGMVRPNNEDAILVDPSGALWAVADGIGGYGHGEVAAELAIEYLSRLPHYGATAGHLVTALEEANQAIRRWAASRGIDRMGATVVAALIADGAATVAWVGDSRAYRLRGGDLVQITRDHSVVQELLEGGRITAAEAEQHPQAHVITRALGAGDRVEVALADAALRPGDVLLLCSDGLTGCLADPEIAPLLGGGGEPDGRCRALVEAALRRGAPDNVSVIVVDAAGAGGP